jgi:hypothetical protein
MKDPKNRVSLIRDTGSSSGPGFLRFFAKERIQVPAADMQEGSVQKVARYLQDRGPGSANDPRVIAACECIEKLAGMAWVGIWKGGYLAE